MRAWMFVVLVACGDSKEPLHVLDARAPDVFVEDECGGCNYVLGVGCPADNKCAWVHQTSLSQPGFAYCVANGTVPIGGACSYAQRTSACTAGGSELADDCARGGVCVEGICKAVCDNQGGNPTCDANHACVTVPGLFQYGSANPYGAGVCEPACDPLADNDLLGSGARGSGCVAGSGCYGELSGGTPPTTQFWCAADGSAALVNRSAVAMPAVNSCAEGYLPLVHASTGSTTVVCVAMCAPGDTYLGNAGSQAAAGVAPHRCASSDARGVFGAHEHCMYVWRLEQDGSGNLLPSKFSDALGVCIDHAQYRYDSNGDGAIDGSDASWPDCQDLPLGSASMFGCVSTMTAGTLPGEPLPGL